MLSKATRSSFVVVLSSSKALMKFPHTHAYALPNESPTIIVKTFALPSLTKVENSPQKPKTLAAFLDNSTLY
jgi:hypothetical protein